MADLEVLNPVANRTKEDKKLAPRLSDLSGKTIGLCWNGKPTGDVVNQLMAKLFTSKFENIHFKEYTGSVGVRARPSYIWRLSNETIDTIVKECDAAIVSLAD